MSERTAERLAPPHEAPADLVTSRRGAFWIPGDVVPTGQGTLQSGPAYVQWEAPEHVTQPYPLVLVHGGGGQGTDWLTTVDGRPGWAAHFVAAGFAVYVVDRPGHGRSPFHPVAIGEMGPPFPYEAARGLFLPDDAAAEQTQWPYGREPGTPELDQLLAAMGPLPADLGLSERLDADRIARLLDRTGPAVLVTHSAGGPVGWLVADARPDLVQGIAAVEPMGPPFAEFPGMGTLSWGLTAAPITYDPPARAPEELRGLAPSERRLPNLDGLPVGLFTGGASVFATFAQDVVDYLNAGGADARWIHLPDLGIDGNGHGLIFEANSDDTVVPVVRWIEGQWQGR
ncbi:alpha/beta fold hydrolase [Georgenia sp. SYP-B2076]|uniref:alpha/beta fold hydrolase n=1 Tax=Georgenia sp. SYP-B2076 TaxID=2495881 RepID=UPI000F8DE24B|nr:alpha/beta fold hydrolase [Georgenia sp. SYP-B2076]